MHDNRLPWCDFWCVKHWGAMTCPHCLTLTGEPKMERVTLRIPKQQIEEVERMVYSGEYPNRSEAIRSAVRDMLNEQEDTRDSSDERKRSWAKV